MKLKTWTYFSAAIIPLLAGCASNPMALAPVGPDAGGRTVSGAKGYLEVFTATEKSAPIASDDNTYFDLHSGYDINDPSGKSIKYVPNHASNMDESPDRVTLPAGNYNIVAKSTCCGLVTVPVVIEKGKTTIVHLDRNWFPPSNISTNRLVFLPNGETVGWSGPPQEVIGIDRRWLL
jgi:hypothetical protein